MPTVVLPHTITAGNPATASDVQENFEALRDGVNSIDRTQIEDTEIHTGLLEDDAVTEAKLADGTVSTDKLASEAVTNAKIADGTITAAKFDSTVRILSQQCKTDTIIGNSGDPGTGQVVDFDFTDLDATDTSILPQVTVYWEDTDPAHPGQWVAMSGNTILVTVRCKWSVGIFNVQVQNNMENAPASREFKVVVTAKAAPTP